MNPQQTTINTPSNHQQSKQNHAEPDKRTPKPRNSIEDSKIPHLDRKQQQSQREMRKSGRRKRERREEEVK